MNILAFSNCPLDPVLGSGRTRQAWRDGLRARGHQVEVVDSLELLGTDHRRPAGRRRRLAWRAWRRLQAMDLAGVDLIEFYGAEFVLPTWLLSRRPRGCRPLLVAHTDGFEPLATRSQRRPAVPWATRVRGQVVRRLDALAFARADGFIAGCEADRDCALELGLCTPARTAVIPVGLDEPFLAAVNAAGAGGDGAARGQEIAFLGTWIPRKGIATLVNVMDALLAARPDLRLTLLGTGGEGFGARDAFAPAVRSRVTVAPRMGVEDLAARLCRAGIFFFPSRYEGFGLALGEAMACGCAVVTTPTGFGAELRDGEEALICPFDDAVAMRAAVERLLDDAALRSRLAAAGRARANSLRWAESVRRLEAVYEGWVAEG